MAPSNPLPYQPPRKRWPWILLAVVISLALVGGGFGLSEYLRPAATPSQIAAQAPMVKQDDVTEPEEARTLPANFCDLVKQLMRKEKTGFRDIIGRQIGFPRIENAQTVTDYNATFALPFTASCHVLKIESSATGPSVEYYCQSDKKLDALVTGLESCLLDVGGFVKNMSDREYPTYEGNGVRFILHWATRESGYLSLK